MDPYNPVFADPRRTVRPIPTGSVHIWVTGRVNPPLPPPHSNPLLEFGYFLQANDGLYVV